MAQKLITGGGTGTASWAVHSDCGRFRGTDPLITGRTRRALAEELGHPDTTAGIPQARWMRALTFENLAVDDAFAGELVARALGWSDTGFAPPEAVVTADCHGDPVETAEQLRLATERAGEGEATLLHRLVLPFPGVATGQAATPVLPDLAVVAAHETGPRLLIGDVKDYERVRSTIDDQRLMKGFLQVAVGTLAATGWSGRPAGLSVSRHGFLVVPRSVFLQPTVEVEDLRDYLTEVQLHITARADAAAESVAVGSAQELVEHLTATFDPASCTSCSLFNHCRDELQRSDDLLTEIGVPEAERSRLRPVLDGGDPLPGAGAGTTARVRATVEGWAAPTDRLRLDPLGQPGVVQVVLAKSDAAALGHHGIGLRGDNTDWQFHSFDDPQADTTRRRVMALLGEQLQAAMAEHHPVHVVVPDAASADLLASTADLLAGVELSRLRWGRDEEMGRPALTHQGEPARIPAPLSGVERTAVSFLLEQDRARALRMRTPVLVATDVLARHLIPGGASVLARRLDYTVRWAGAQEQLDHRAVAAEIEAVAHTPGARLNADTSDVLHEALAEPDKRHYRELVVAELGYKAQTLDAAATALADIGVSRFAAAARSFEADAQAVWRRRLALGASDLVRFGRTYRFWRNRLVDVIQRDLACANQVDLLTSPLHATEAADDAGTRQVAHAEVISLDPVVVDVDSRRFSSGVEVLALTCNGESWLEVGEGVELGLLKGSVKVENLPLGYLRETDGQRQFEWELKTPVELAVGDQLILADASLFERERGVKKKWLNLARPTLDAYGAPKEECGPDSHEVDPEAHQWCCRPHEVIEAEFSDHLAQQRDNDELNPQVWPPVRDADGFEVAPVAKPSAATVRPTPVPVPEGLTIDELD